MISYSRRRNQLGIMSGGCIENIIGACCVPVNNANVTVSQHAHKSTETEATEKKTATIHFIICICAVKMSSAVKAYGDFKRCMT